MALLQRRTVRATALLAAAERAERATARRQADAQTIGVKLPRCAGRAAAGAAACRACVRACEAARSAADRRARRSAADACARVRIEKMLCFFFLRDGENGTLLFFFCVQSVCFLYR